MEAVYIDGGGPAIVYTRYAKCILDPQGRYTAWEKMKATIEIARAGARTLIGGGGGVHIRIFGFCATNLFLK